MLIRFWLGGRQAWKVAETAAVLEIAVERTLASRW